MSAERINISAVREREPLQDHCGIIGAFAASEFRFLSSGVEGLRQLQPRGHDGAGVVALNTQGGIVLKHKGEGKVREVFDESVMRECQNIFGSLWVMQTRWGTNGDPNQSANSVQPIITNHYETGEVVIVAHNGEFADQDTVGRNGPVSDTVLFADRLAKSDGKNWMERVKNTVKEEEGAFSLVIGTKDGLILARDPRGIRPLSYGQYWDRDLASRIWVAASETYALNKIGADGLQEVLPGRMILLAPNGEIEHRLSEKRSKVCIFENVYVSHGRSKAHLPRTSEKEINEAPLVGDIRRRSGEILAQEAPLTSEDVDFVVGIPGTGIAGGRGFAHALGLSYEQVIFDDEIDTDDNRRTFMNGNVAGIYKEILDDHNFDLEALEGKSVCLVDDSIVRGNVTKVLVDFLRNVARVKSIHARIVCPPIDEPCVLGVNTRGKDELIAARVAQAIGENTDLPTLVEGIRKELNLDSLAYVSEEGLKEAQNGDRHDERFCTDCMTKLPASQPVALGRKTLFPQVSL